METSKPSPQNSQAIKKRKRKRQSTKIVGNRKRVHFFRISLKRRNQFIVSSPTMKTLLLLSFAFAVVACSQVCYPPIYSYEAVTYSVEEIYSSNASVDVKQQKLRVDLDFGDYAVSSIFDHPQVRKLVTHSRKPSFLSTTTKKALPFNAPSPRLMQKCSQCATSTILNAPSLWEELFSVIDIVFMR